VRSKLHSVTALLGCMLLLGHRATGPQGHVLPGIDVLLTDSVHLIDGKRIGLITNQSGIDARGISTIDRLFSLRPPATGLVALFAPEHGIRGTARPGERVDDTRDSATGLPIYSLYGSNRAPSAAQLADLDVLVVDLQDVGTRTWTYVSTMLYAMRAAAAAGKPILVLDRPNPIGCAMQGPVLDTANASFIALLPVPLRHGLTMGELARFGNGVLNIHAALTVVPVKGWRRCDWFDRTGLPWVPPSPNLPTLESVAWYPGTVLFEASNLSVGRGTSAPFRMIGAPWFRLRRATGFQRVSFRPQAPGDGKYADSLCAGVRFPAFDRARERPIEKALALLAQAERENPRLRVDERGLRMRLGRAGRDPGSATELADFRQRIAAYLLYR
jgi:uncharacterized protein YbbC (DUF1343 family)